jgi:hypothetical protein
LGARVLDGLACADPADRVKKYLSFCRWGSPFPAAGLRFNERSQKPVHRNLHVHRRRHHDQLGAYGHPANQGGPLAGGGRRRTMTIGLAQTRCQATARAPAIQRRMEDYVPDSGVATRNKVGEKNNYHQCEPLMGGVLGRVASSSGCSCWSIYQRGNHRHLFANEVSRSPVR